MKLFGYILAVTALYAFVIIWALPSAQEHLTIVGADCRLPDPVTEYRVIIQKRDEPGRLIETCSIEPRNNEEGPRATMKRLLKRKNTNA